MIEDSDQLRQAIETLHHCKAHFIKTVEVKETFKGQKVWEGIAHVFEITGNPQANKCYAWSSPIEGSAKRKFFAVLHVPPITSAKDAVRAAIVREYRRDRGD